MRLSFGEFVLDDEARQLSGDEKPVHLTPKAFELLEFLIERRPRAVSKADLSERLWPETHVTEANLPVLVHEVREALGDDPHDANWVRTVARFGYAFCGDVRRDPVDGEGEESRPGTAESSGADGRSSSGAVTTSSAAPTTPRCGSTTPASRAATRSFGWLTRERRWRMPRVGTGPSTAAGGSRERSISPTGTSSSSGACC